MKRGRPIRAVRSGVERAVCALSLIALSPVLAGVSGWIRLTSGRPVLFVQERIGRDGVPFRMLKFRTMVVDAITVGQSMNLTDDPFGIIDDDPRITRPGRFLRRTSLDELPQLWNVVRGDMSLVGPRPDVPEQARHYTPSEQRRLKVMPGITGWAQINGRDELPWPQRFELDAWYVENRSVLLDLRILCLTVAQIGRAEPVTSPDEFNIARQVASDG